jgi:hypothetical protein
LNVVLANKNMTAETVSASADFDDGKPSTATLKRRLQRPRPHRAARRDLDDRTTDAV